MTAFGAYQPIPFPTTKVRVRPVSSHSGKLSVGREAFNFNRRQPQDVSRCWWPQLGEDEVVEVIAPFTVQRRIGRPANSS